ncbi:hypothetical protein BT93_L3511 [Corymbia citriodora subsp. variegata]|uniref:Uncharacterized protein n=1 Tax=Corymbia citriodora subsp. variegata TaxID=360336 RepID=A0A8T0CLF0_CORYI|nr:hypothetical protein BT93_L3511 [Corymbia citriodora subsp. variegata]
MPTARLPQTNIWDFPAFTPHHAILAFLVTILINLVEVKYQGNRASPFDTRPFATSLTIFCLLFYCSLSFVAHLSLVPDCCARALLILMVLTASLLVASLTSLLFPSSFHYFPYLLLFVLLSVVLLYRLTQNLCMWVQQKIASIFVSMFRSWRLHVVRAAPPLLPRMVRDARLVRIGN